MSTSMASLVIPDASVIEISRGKADTQTNGGENLPTYVSCVAQL